MPAGVLGSHRKVETLFIAALSLSPCVSQVGTICNVLNGKNQMNELKG